MKSTIRTLSAWLNPRRMLIVGLLSLVAAWSVFAFATNQALAGDRRRICSDKVYVRNYPQGRAWDQLYRGQTFEVYEYRASGWARGFAYGHINSDRSPYRKPYDDVWIQVSAFCPR
ncbi:MAG TPA: hypothetical protein VF666_11220 [Pyrinomonadaceae bacterium]|jgi:hypothetical protein